MNRLSGEGPSINLLLVDSHPDDAESLRESFETGDQMNSIQVAQTGGEALDALHDRSDCEDSPRPNLVVLDLDLSDLDGIQLLSELKETPELRHIPVLVMARSDEMADILRSYDLNANAYLQKPDDSDELVDVARLVEGFWGEHATLPPP